MKRLVTLAGAERLPEIGGIFLSEAHVERAGAGEADAVAALAEIMGHGRDEAEAPARLLHPDITSRDRKSVV